MSDINSWAGHNPTALWDKKPPGTCAVSPLDYATFPTSTISFERINSNGIPDKNVNPENGTYLTTEELRVLYHLREAWAAFAAIEKKHPDDNDEFRHALHTLQYLIAKRVAVRLDPNVWTQY